MMWASLTLSSLEAEYPTRIFERPGATPQSGITVTPASFAEASRSRGSSTVNETSTISTPASTEASRAL
jgi:hypothetical protein